MTAQEKLDAAIDQVLDALEHAAKEGVEVDPLQTILARVQARGQSFDMSELDPMTRMVLGGILG